MVPMAVLVASSWGRDPGIGTTTLAAVTVVPLVLWRIVRLNRFRASARVAIARQERYYRALATNSSDAFLVVDRDAKVLDASAALYPLAGFTGRRSSVPTAWRSCSRRIAGLARRCSLDSLAKPGLTVSGEVRIRTAEDSTLWVELRCTNLLDDRPSGVSW